MPYILRCSLTFVIRELSEIKCVQEMLSRACVAHGGLMTMSGWQLRMYLFSFALLDMICFDPQMSFTLVFTFKPQAYSV